MRSAACVVTIALKCLAIILCFDKESAPLHQRLRKHREVDRDRKFEELGGIQVDNNTLRNPLQCPPWFLPGHSQQNSGLEDATKKAEEGIPWPIMTSEERDLSTRGWEGEITTTPDLCYCSDTFTEVVQCSDRDQMSYITFTFCMSYDHNAEMVLVGKCPYFRATPDIRGFWIPLPQNVSRIGEKLCGRQNREGLLCGRCIEGYGISVYTNTFECVDCEARPYGWLWFFFSEIILQTLFFLVAFFFRINVNTAQFNGFVLFCQIIISTRIDLILPQYLANTGQTRLRGLVTFLGVFYRFWVLDFFTLLIPPACFHRELDMLGAVALRYVSAFYPFVLILLTSLLVRLRDCNFKPVSVVWRPYQRLKRAAHRYIDLRQSLLHTFSSFIVLSYSKLALVSFSLLAPTNIYNASDVKIYNNRWYHDAEIRLFDRRHAPYGILALVVTMTFLAAPPLVLVLYPFKWFRWLLHKVRLDRPALNTFVDAFQGCYKDGTENSKDRRCFSALYFVLRLLFFATLLIASVRWQINIINLIFATSTILFAYTQPYKKRVYNLVDTFFLSLLTLQYFIYLVSITHGNMNRSFSVMNLFILVSIGCVPILYFTLVLLHHIFKSVKVTKKWRRWIMKCRKREDLVEPWPYRLMDEEVMLSHRSKTI